MMEEEVWGVLTKDEFGKFLGEFTRRFGKPVYSKRLTFSFWDHRRNNIDTRIRVTNGKAEIMQKVGKWEGSQIRSRSEQSVKLDSDLEVVFGAYKVLRVLIPGEDQCYIYQTEDYIFRKNNFEIKITHQTGKTDKYLFEVEAIAKKVDLKKVVRDLELTDLVRVTDEEFWNKWNEELNLKDNDINEDKLKNLINEYLRA